MRKVFAPFLILGMLGSIFLSTAEASIKPGSSCSKLNQTSTSNGYKYTCVKVGKNLMWSKGVLVVTPKPSPTPTPSPSASLNPFMPWSSTFGVKEMTNAALLATTNYFGLVEPSNNYELNIDPKISDADRGWIEKTLSYANGSFSSLPRERVKIFLGTSHAWSLNTLKSLNIWIGDSNSPFPCSQGINDAYCAEKNFILLIYSDIYSANSSFRWDIGRRSTPAHELFHTVQFSLLGTNKNLHVPRWLMEGSANFFGYFVAEKLGFGTYQEGRDQQVTRNPAYSLVIPLEKYDGFESDPYGIGQAASEYLIASVGFEKFLNIWRFTNTEGSFSAGFEKATGISLDAFYLKFESARGSMRIGS